MFQLSMNEPSNYTSSTTWTTSSSHGDMSDMFLSNNDFVNSLELASECLQAKRLFQNGQLIMASFIATSSRGAQHVNPRSHWMIKISSRYVVIC